MGRFHLTACLAILVAAQSFAAEEGIPAIGARIADLRFKDIRGLNRSLNDLGQKRAYVFVFVASGCPIVRRSMPKLAELDERFRSRDVQFVAVNVGPEETIRDAAAQAIEYELAFPFVKDEDLSCAKALGISRTPEVAVINSDRQLVYRGRIDDQLRVGGSRAAPTRRDLEQAILEVLEGTAVSVAETTVDGCLITAYEPLAEDAPAPTFHKDVAPIIYQRCVQCHRENAAGPFPLTSYAEVKSHAEMIAEVVADQTMPPWFANSKHGKFQNDPSLSREERDTVVAWVRSGRKEGDPSDAPTPPEFPSSAWRIGTPDLVITTLDEHEIPATGFVPYRRTLLPYMFLNDTWLEAIEIKPDNLSVVHHCNMAYVSKDGAGHHTFMTGHVPGGQPMDLGRFNNGVAFMVPRFSGLGLEIHYTTTGKVERCRISVGFRFPRQTVHKRLKHFLLDPRGFEIEPGNGAFPIKASHTLDKDISLLGLFTHMHVRGKDMTFFAVQPGKSKETLLQIPNYNFEWQLGYEIAPGQKRLPRGTRIEAVAHYDNSSFNPYNPDPTKTVTYGPQTVDEMFNGYGFYVDEEEDLNLSLDPKTGLVKKASR